MQYIESGEQRRNAAIDYVEEKLAGGLFRADLAQHVFSADAGIINFDEGISLFEGFDRSLRRRQ